MDTSLLDAFDARFGLDFVDRRLLQQAFVHRSFLNERAASDATLADNERLEFLGDSVLGFIVSELLYRRFPAAHEGTLTHLRTLLVRRETLARLAIEMEMGALLMLGVGEEESGGRERSATLCASFEALVGAIFLDQGLEKVTAFVLPPVEAILREIQVEVMPKDPKSRFQEWSQRTNMATPRYRLADHYGPDHAKTFIILVTVKGEPLGVGLGPSKQDASQAAAACALFAVGESAPEYTPNVEVELRFGVRKAPSSVPEDALADPLESTAGEAGYILTTSSISERSASSSGAPSSGAAAAPVAGP